MSAVLEQQDTSLDAVARHFINRFTDPDIIRYPFPHTYVSKVFPEDYYKEMLHNLPPDEAYPDRQFENRAMTRQTSLSGIGPFWHQLTEWMTKPAVMRILLDIFNLDASGSVQYDLRLVRDSAGYAIKPHTDIKAKLLSFLFYLPADNLHPGTGTRVYIPKNEGFRSDGTSRYPFRDFTEVYAAPFVPNTCFAFPRSDVSFHGVPATDFGPRNVLLLNVYRFK